MKVGFIGLGRMGEVMARRLIDGGHEVGVYNRTPDKLKPLTDAGAKARRTRSRPRRQFGDAVFTMLTDDAAALEVVGQAGGLKESLPKGGVHICAGTHSVAAIQKLKAIHAEAGQVLIASPMLGRPGSGRRRQCRHRGRRRAGRRSRACGRCSPRSRRASSMPAPSRQAPRSSRSPTISCSAAPSRRWARAFRWCANTASRRTCFISVLTEGLFNCWAYKTYGKFIADEQYLPAGQRALNGLKDANLALAAGEAAGVPLPSGNVWRDRLVGAVAHGEGEHDWAVMAKDQARASGLA